MLRRCFLQRIRHGGKKTVCFPLYRIAREKAGYGDGGNIKVCLSGCVLESCWCCREGSSGHVNDLPFLCGVFFSCTENGARNIHLYFCC